MSYPGCCGDGSDCSQKMHGLSSAYSKLSGASAQSTKRKETVLTTRRQLGKALALPQVRCFNAIVVRILSLSQRTPRTIANANLLECRELIIQAGATKAGYEGGQYPTIKSSNSKANQNLTPTAGPNAKASALYIIKTSPGKGLGMFTTKDIPKGTRIVAEKPFLSFAKRPVVSLSDPYAPNNISKAFSRLTAIEKLIYMDLHCPDRNDCSLIVSVYEANSYEMGAGTCICLDASRINHSCIPNAHYSWNDSAKQITVRDIPEGQEVTISYCSAFRTLEKRKRKLKPYVFICCCPACQTGTGFASRSQIRRQQMFDLDQEIADYQNDPLAARAEYGHCDELFAIQRIISLMKEEGLVYEKSLAYHDAAKWALKRGLRVKAEKYARKELEVDLCCVGRDSPSYRETMTFLLGIHSGADELSD